MQRARLNGEFRRAVGQKQTTEGSSSLCAHDDMNIIQPILLFDSFILPADIIFHYFPQSIKFVTGDISQYTPNVCQSCCKLCAVSFRPKCSDSLIWTIQEHRRTCFFSVVRVDSVILGNLPAASACFPSWLSERPKSLSCPHSEVHTLLDMKTNATAMGSIIINEKWHHRVVCLTAIRLLSLQHSMRSRCLFD